MKEHLLTLTQRDRPLRAPFASIMGLESDTQLKLADDDRKGPAGGFKSGTSVDSRAPIVFSKVSVWLIALALACLSLSYWVISRYPWF